ncbi:MAG TPA: NAD-dependent epimerase/dehydratase family protein [Bacteroidales bacterium]|nr:NAD-dependent epimerase/dehydratase family protein [Bacteroidales bacterium]
MKVLITGSSGYFGSILTNHLIASGISVIGLDIRENPILNRSDFFRYYNCSITDRQELASIVSAEQPTHVVHFACTFNKLRDQDKEYTIDVGGSENLLAAVNRTLSVKQLIYSSSAAVYGGYPDNPEWISEDYEPRPGKYSYGINKRTIENMFLSGKRPGLKVVITRVCTLSGPSYSNERVLLKLIAEFPVFPLFYKYNRLQLIHEHDFVALMSEILRDPEINGIYNLASDTSSYISDLSPDKKFLLLPKFVMRSLMWTLWTLRIFNLQPSSLDTSIYPVILDPQKLVKRYNYKFEYTTESAFNEIQSRFTSVN